MAFFNWPAVIANSVGASAFPLLAPNGTLSAPSYSFSASPQTGMFSSATSYIDFTCNGTDVLTLNSTSIGGSVPFIAPTGTVGAPGFAFSGRATTGCYSAGAGLLDFAAGGVQAMELSATAVAPQLQILNILGLVGSPSYSFTGRASSGLYSPGASQVAVATGGVQAVLFDASQNATFAGSVGTGTVTATGSLILKTNAGTTALTLDTAQNATIAGQVTSTGASAGTAFTNFANVLNISNSSGVNTWAAYNFFSSGSASSAGAIACQSTDVTNHYGSIAIGTRGAGGYKIGLTVDQNQNCIVGLPSLGTTATNGFLYIPSVAGAPSGVPTAISGQSPIQYDTTNNKLWVYNGAWKGVVLA